MTTESIETKARRILNDNFEPYRWSSDEIREALQMGVHALNGLRPETRYISGTLVDNVHLPESRSEAIDIEDKFEEALVYFVCYQCYLNDDSDTINQNLAEAYLGKFNTKAQL